jgi:hypothetical protein
MTTLTDPNAILANPDLIALGMQGNEVRRRMHGSRTTFVRVFEVHVNAPPAALPSGLTAGEIRIVGRPASEDVAFKAVEAVATLIDSDPLTKERRPLVSGFSLADLEAWAPTTAAIEALCRRLTGFGLEAIAETPIDLLADAVACVTAARNAGVGVERLTVHSLSEGQRIPIVERARDLQHSIGGFRAFAPLPRSISVATPTTGYDDVKQVVLARVIASNIDSIQVDWPLYGPKLAQVALTMGADDVDGIAAVDSGALGTRRSPIEEIKGNIRAAGLDAVERDGRFQLLS